ncbi:hypothetical protein FXN61_00520 [Lentzea sp. PSKA42]|uniref:Uncharacterized protein n=1 Tax=Lentzea indica TaxID=2604800 RepID=A0ABX1F9J5_9PSEU|nr:hypothetical protein [Lentzea indica]NKE55391.1 hypothetical protein [Lentzea indica]
MSAVWLPVASGSHDRVLALAAALAEAEQSSPVVPGAVVGTAALLYAVRYCLVIRSLPVRPRETAWLLLIAPLLPLEEARSWIADFEGQLGDLEPKQRDVVRSHIGRSFVVLLRATWAAWVAKKLDVLRELSSWLTAMWMLPRISRMNALLRSKMPVWPKHEEQRHQRQRQMRKLRFWGRLLESCVSERHHPKIVTNAAWLAKSCSGLLAEQARTDRPRPEDRLPCPLEVAYMLEINHTTLVITELVEQLATSRRSWRRKVDGAA